MDDCLFCLVAAKKIPSTIVYEDNDLIAFKDIHPKAPVHLLVIPKKHISTVNDLKKSDSEMVGRMIYQAKLLARQFKIAQSGFKLIINSGRSAGQVVDHLHLHILGGKDLRSTT